MDFKTISFVVLAVILAPIAGGLLAISVGATVLAALAAFGVVRLRAKLRRKRKARH